LKAAALIFAISLLVSNTVVHAQAYKNEISVTLGAFTFPDIAETSKDIGGIIVLFGLFRQESSRATPAIILSYGRSVKEDLRVGLSFGYQKFNVEYFLADSPRFTTEVSYFHFMARGDYTYFTREWVRLYSGAGIGMAVVTEEEQEEKSTDTEYWFAFQVNALGARIGKRVAGFVELGFGYNGILSAGITAAF
jgi:hypothetical protein